jgi:hypothetical protein
MPHGVPNQRVSWEQPTKIHGVHMRLKINSLPNIREFIVYSYEMDCQKGLDKIGKG